MSQLYIIIMNDACCGGNITNGSVTATGGSVVADSAFFNTINSVANDNTATINGVNPLTTDTNLAAHIVATTAHGTTSAIVGADDAQTLTNKTIASDVNVVTLSSVGGDNINDVLDQRVTTTSNVSFLDVTTVGGVFAGGAGQFSQVLTAAINDPSASNNCLINGVNPLTISNDLAAHIAASTAHGTTSTIVGINDSQRLTNKNIAVPSCKLVDNSDSTKIVNVLVSGATTGTNTQLTFNQTANRVITFPDLTTTLVGTDTTQTLTNKLLTGCTFWDGTGQTIQFNTAAVTGPRTWTAPDGDITVCGIAFPQTLSNKTIDNTNTINGTSIRGASYTTSAINQPITFDTTALGAPRSISWIDSAGTVTLIAAIQTLANKTIDSASNTLTITSSPLSATNINNLINQDIRTTAAPQFTGLNYYVSTTKAVTTFPISASSAAGATTIILNIPVATNTAIGIFAYLTTRKLTGTIQGYGSYIYDWKAINNAGTVTQTNGNNQAKSEQAVAGAFAGKITPSIAVNGSGIDVRVANTFVDGTLITGGYIEVLFA